MEIPEAADRSGDVILSLRGLERTFGGIGGVSGVSLDIHRGEIYTLLGPSGCGKTTTLRLVAGMEKPLGGVIVYHGRVVADPKAHIFVPPHKRNLGMVFQSYAIWPHMTVYQNIAYPLKIRNVDKQESRHRVEAILRMVGMEAMIDRPATMLSGGQQQRVAICRALVHEPDLLLLDEPFSNLDAKLRHQMRVEIRQIQRRLGVSVLFVTHDQSEALTLSDRIAVMESGKIVQVGTPTQLYDRPSSPLVRDFLGRQVLVDGTVTRVAEDGSVFIRPAGGAPDAGDLLCRPAEPGQLSAGAPAIAAIRPEHIEVVPGQQHHGETGWMYGTVVSLVFVGQSYEMVVQLSTGQQTTLEVTRSAPWAEGETVSLRLPATFTYAWPGSASSPRK